MEYLILPFIALIASLLTFFSGFGLGTILLPVFSLFFPIPIAIALTAIIHLLNNIFKFFLVGKNTNWKIVINFGVPAIFAAFFGALAFTGLSRLPPIAQYQLFGKVYSFELLKVIVGLLLLIFATLDLKNELLNLHLKKKHLIFGGILSGFFGGLAGFQGAFRSLFLINCKLTKEEFIATGVVIACMVDLARIPTYSLTLQASLIKHNFLLLLLTIGMGFIGAYLGSVFLKKTTIQFLKLLIAIFIYVVGICLIMGWV